MLKRAETGFTVFLLAVLAYAGSAHAESVTVRTEHKLGRGRGKLVLEVSGPRILQIKEPRIEDLLQPVGTKIDHDDRTYSISLICDKYHFAYTAFLVGARHDKFELPTDTDQVKVYLLRKGGWKDEDTISMVDHWGKWRELDTALSPADMVPGGGGIGILVKGFAFLEEWLFSQYKEDMKAKCPYWAWSRRYERFGVFITREAWGPQYSGIRWEFPIRVRKSGILRIATFSYTVASMPTLEVEFEVKLVSALPKVAYVSPEIKPTAHLGGTSAIRIGVENTSKTYIPDLWLDVYIKDSMQKMDDQPYGNTVEYTKTPEPSSVLGESYGRLIFSNQGQRLEPGETRTFEATYTFDKDIWGNPYKPDKYILKYASWEGNPGDGVMLSELQTHEFELKPSPVVQRIRDLIEEIEKKEQEAAPRLAAEKREHKLREQEEQKLQRQIVEAMIRKNQASEREAREEIDRSIQQMTNDLFSLLRERERLTAERTSRGAFMVSIWTVPRSISVWQAGQQGKGLTICFSSERDADVEIWRELDTSQWPQGLVPKPPSRTRLLSRWVEAGRTYQVRTRLPSEIVELARRMEKGRQSVGMPLPRVRGKVKYLIKARAGGGEASNSTYVTYTE